MRLIDADKLIEDLKSSRFFIAGLRCNKSILGQTMTQYAKLINKTIEEQPTAFDMDKVVEQLEELSHCDWIEVRKEEVFEIVKAGGRDE